MNIIVKELNKSGSDLLLYLTLEDNTIVKGVMVSKCDVDDEVNKLKTNHNVYYDVEIIKYKEYINE